MKTTAEQKRRLRLEQLRDRFIAATLGTPSLRLRRLARSRGLDLSRLKEKDPRAFEEVLSALGQSGSTDVANEAVALCDIRPDANLEAFADDVSVLAHAAREERLESGSDDLAIGWPFLEGSTRDGTWIRAPLLLFPISLKTSKKGRLSWQLRSEGPAVLNEPLVEFLVREQGFRLDFTELFDDETPQITEQSWGQISRHLQKMGLPFGESFDEGSSANETSQKLPPLQKIDPVTSEERETAALDSFQLRHHIVMGRFPVSASNVIVDYDEILARNLDAQDLGLAAELLLVDEDAEWQEEAALEDRDDTADEELSNDVLGDWQRWQVFASDASQDAVFRFVENATDRDGIVVQGPPGTGKSQLIANFVGAAIALGQRVLVVCTKRAALDVVAARLTASGLGEPIAVVHDVGRDRNEVCADLESTLSQLEDHLSGATTRQREIARAEAEHQRALDRLAARLQHSHQAFSLLATSQNGKPPLAELQERALDDDHRPLPDMVPVADAVTEAELFEKLPRLETLAPLAAPLATPHPLGIRGAWEDFDEDDFQDLFEVIAELCDITGDAGALEDATMTPEESIEHEALWTEVAPLIDVFESDDSSLADFLLFWTWTDGRTETGEWQRVMATLKEARDELSAVPHELITTSRDVLEQWLQELARLSELHDLWYRFVLPEFWRLRKVPSQILDHCVSWSAKASSMPVDISGLCRQAIKWQELIEAMPDDNPLFDFGFSGHPRDIELSIDSLRRQHTNTRCLHTLQQALSHRGAPYDRLPNIGPEIADPMEEVALFRAAVADRRRARMRSTVDQQLGDLANTGGLDFAVCDELRRAFDGANFDAVLSPLAALLDTTDQVQEAVEIDGLLRDEPRWIRHFLKRWRPADAKPDAKTGAGEDAIVATERAWKALLTGERDRSEVEAPLIDEEYLFRLREDLERCRKVAGEGMHGQYVRRIAEAAGNNERRRALQQLAAEVGRRRNRPSLRQLTERFWHRGLSLIRPVWFCSPEAVSALFPLESGFFDVVIFDEASQCPVESALPALVRSDKAVIAGDDQQMPPSRFFRAAFDSEDEDSTLLATRSILQLARATFTNTTLRWHYRSRHEELIAFSNRAFYGGRLITAPMAEEIQTPDVEGLHLAKVDGLWVDQQNEIEARKVVDIIERLLVADDPPSIGVVTFNRRQAELIEHLLDGRAAAHPAFRKALQRDDERTIVDQLFIRNLENVQGDQRDVIILCTGYGPTEPGGTIHARFGPVSQEGGEKRLNVAITRARKGLWLVTSMKADQLEVSHTRNVGPKLLRAYLGFVEAHSRSDAPSVTKWLSEAHSLGGGRGVTGTSRQSGPKRGPGQRVRRELTQALRERGFTVEEDVGLGSHCLDLTLSQHSEEPARLGIDCTSFLSDPDSLSRDVHGPAFWRRLGWTVLRVSPAMWLHDRERTLNRISQHALTTALTVKSG